MGKKSKFNLSVIIPLLGLIVSTSIFLFGNNVFDRFTGPKIMMNSTRITLNYPKDMVQALNQYAAKNKILFFPNCYRSITIKNTGFIASKNANIQIKVGGDIFDLSSYSTESISDKKQIDNCTYNIQMPRLSTNAYIEIKVWAKDNNQPISVIYADDYNSRQLIESDLSSESYTITKILMIAIIFMSLGFLVKHMLLKISKNMEEKRLQQDYELLIKLGEMFDEKEAEKEKQEEAILQQDQVSEKGDEENKERLRKLIRKVREM